MQELYELKELLCEELKDYGKKGEMTAGSLEVIDKLAHAAKNIDKLIESEEGYSGNDQSYNSYARGRGTYAKRDSMGRYSSRRGYSREYSRNYSREYSRDGIADKLRELVEEAPDEKTRNEIQRLAEKMEQM